MTTTRAQPGLAMGSAAASTPSFATASAAQPLPFRRDADEVSFPLAGAVLLLVLLAIAAWAWTVGRRRGKAAVFTSRWPFVAASPDGSNEQARVVGSTRLDLGGRVYVVEWRGRQILVAVNGTSAQVVLARREVDTPDPRAPA